MTAPVPLLPLPSARHAAWKTLCAEPSPEVLVIGGGVNGVGVLRDLALNGVTAALIDSGDFCGGASGASSRMAHGGLRYLEGREFKLVAEAARERNLLLHDASHVVRPLEIVVPLQYRVRGLGSALGRFAGLTRRPGPLSLVALKGALALYERFGAVRRALPPHSVRLSREQYDPGHPPWVRAVVSYYDGQILNPESLVLEMLEDAAVRPGICAINHVAWQADGRGGIDIRDRLGARRTTLRPRLIVNAAGAAIDQVNHALGIAGRLVRGVKGAHLLLRNPRLQARMAGRAFYFDDGAGRMVICLPVGNCVLMGTTEVETADPADHSVAAEEVDYLLAALGRLFTDITPRRDEVVAVTSGIRPLQASEGNATQAARDHALAESRHGALPVISLVGGKWTTFRAFAEQATDRVLDHLGRTRQVGTAGLAYPGAAPVDTAGLAARLSLPVARIETLVQRYGATASVVAALCQGQDAPLPFLPGYSQAEIAWLVQARMACTLEDLVLRRTTLVPSGELTEAGLRSLAVAMASILGHGEDWVAAEVAGATQDPRILGFQAQPDVEQPR